MTSPKKSQPYDWVPERIDWRPGEPKPPALNHGVRVTIREAVAADLVTLCTLLQVGRKVMLKWLSFNRYVVRLAVRNVRYPVGIVVSEHGPTENRIIRWALFPGSFNNPTFPAKLFIGAALELPEVPTVIDVPADDKDTQLLCERLGWTLDGIEDSVNTYRSRPWEPVRAEPQEEPK